MRFLAAAALAASLPGPAALGASFDCAQASTDIKCGICGDSEISALDSTLGNVYTRAIARSEDVESLQASQQSWLRETRDACPDSRCLKDPYRQRITEVMQLTWMTSARARTICETVVEAVNAGSIQESFQAFSRPSREQQERWKTAHPDRLLHYLEGVLKVDYDGDGEIETMGRVAESASCSSLRVSDIHRPRRIVYPPGNQELFRWAHWGNTDHFLFVDGEPVVLTGRFRDVAQAGLLTWFAPDGTARPLCFLQSTSETKARIEEAENTALCKAVAEGSAQFIPWSVPVTIPGEEMNKVKGGLDGGLATAEAYSLTGAELDLDLDGDTELIAPYDYSSGAGCGRNFQWLLEIEPKTASIVSPPRNGFSYGQITHLIGGVVRRSRSPLALFAFNGKPYLLNDTSVFSLWGGESRRWCKYTPLPQHEIAEFYAVETWPESPFAQDP